MPERPKNAQNLFIEDVQKSKIKFWHIPLTDESPDDKENSI